MFLTFITGNRTEQLYSAGQSFPDTGLSVDSLKVVYSERLENAASGLVNKSQKIPGTCKYHD